MKKLTADDLVGVWEIAERLNVSRQAVTNYQARHGDFPKPLTRLHCGPIFYWPDVAAWAARRPQPPD